MRSALTTAVCLTLLALAWAAGPVLADQSPSACPQDAGRLVIASSGYTEAEKVQLEAEITKAQGAHVSPESLARIAVMSMTRRVPAERLVSFFQVLSRVQSSGLPVIAFENKIAEGLAKGAPPDLILQVVAQKEQNYLQARGLMVANLKRSKMYDQAFFRVMELSAEGLRRGLPPEGLGRIFRSQGSSLEEMFRAVRAYLYMQAIGFPLDAGLDIAVAALDSGQFRECHSCLGQVIFTAKRAGASPVRIRDELVQGLRNGRKLGEISRAFFVTPQQ